MKTPKRSPLPGGERMKVRGKQVCLLSPSPLPERGRWGDDFQEIRKEEH